MSVIMCVNQTFECRSECLQPGQLWPAAAVAELQCCARRHLAKPSAHRSFYTRINIFWSVFSILIIELADFPAVF